LRRRARCKANALRKRPRRSRVVVCLGGRERCVNSLRCNRWLSLNVAATVRFPLCKYTVARSHRRTSTFGGHSHRSHHRLFAYGVHTLPPFHG
jgi:hypothetical protein